MSRPLIALLDDLPRTSEYVFPSPQRNGDRPVSTNSASQFLRRNGFADVLVPQGIRAIGRSWMFANQVPFEVMQRWCDYVELCLKGGADLLL